MSEEATAAKPAEDAKESEQTPGSAKKQGDVEGASGNGHKPNEAGSDDDSKFAAMRRKLDAVEAENAKFRKEQQKAADARAVAEGDVTAAQQERDRYAEEAKQWREYATKKLDGIVEHLDDDAQAILAELGDDGPLAQRLAVAERLASRSEATKSDAGFGSSGGKGKAETSSLIPTGINDGNAYHEWMARESESGDPERMKMFFDPALMAKINAEARTKGFIR